MLSETEKNANSFMGGLNLLAALKKSYLPVFPLPFPQKKTQKGIGKGNRCESWRAE
jgi:hypothetical protein